MKFSTWKMIAFLTILSLSALAFLAACGNGGGNAFVGTWESVEYTFAGESSDVTATVEFSADGSVEARTGPMRVVGQYSADGNTAVLTTEDDQRITYELQDNGQLKVENPVLTIVFEKR